MKRWHFALAALLALAMLLALGAAQAESAAAPAEAASDSAGGGGAADSEKASFTVDDYIGTWYLSMKYKASLNDIVSFVFTEVDPRDTKVVIEPGRVTIMDGFADPVAFEGELFVDADGTLYVMVDEAHRYSDCVFRLADIGNGRFLAWQLENTEDIIYYTREVPKQGRLHRDKAIVKAAQQALNDAGYDCGTPDGVVGRNTRAGIRSYQTDRGLTVTGTVTDELLESLGIQ